MKIIAFMGAGFLVVAFFLAATVLSRPLFIEANPSPHAKFVTREIVFFPKKVIFHTQEGEAFTNTVLDITHGEKVGKSTIYTLKWREFVVSRPETFTLTVTGDAFMYESRLYERVPFFRAIPKSVSYLLFW